MMRICAQYIFFLFLCLASLALTMGCGRNSEPDSRSVLIGAGSGSIYIQNIEVKAPHDRLDEKLRQRTPDSVVSIVGDFRLLADGTVHDASNRQLPLLDNVVSLSPRYVVKSDGSLWRWSGDYKSVDLQQIEHTKPAQYVESCGAQWVVLNRDATVTLGNENNVQIIDFGLSDIRTIEISWGCQSLYAIQSDGTVWGWGDNSFGQLGTQLESTSIEIPVAVVTGRNITHLVAGQEYVLLLEGNGHVYGLGRNDVGQLGNGGFSDTDSLTEVSMLSDVIAIGTGGKDSLAVISNNDLYIWGDSIEKYSVTALDRVPVQYAGQILQKISTTGGFTDIDVAFNYNLALHNDGSVWAWGKNDVGQLGLGHMRTISTPTKIDDFENVVDVVITENFSYALKDDGTVWYWGGGFTVPVQTSELGNIIQLVAQGRYALALDQEGIIWLVRDGKFLMSLSGILPVAEAVYEDFTVKLKDGSFWTLYGGDRYSITTIFPNPEQLDDIPLTVFAGIPLENGELVFSRRGGIYRSDSLAPDTVLEEYIPITYWSGGDIVIDNEGHTWIIPVHSRYFYVDGKEYVRVDGAGDLYDHYEWIPFYGKGLMQMYKQAWANLVSIDYDGYIWTMGDNQSGQLGDGKLFYSAVPVLRESLDIQ